MWLRADQHSQTDGVLLDRSGGGHHGYLGGVRRLFVGDWPGGGRVAHFPGVAGNTVGIAGLAAATTYDWTVTYEDDTTASGSTASDGAGVLTLGGVTAEFNDVLVKSIEVEPNGGGATVAFVDFTVLQQGVRSFVSDTGQVVTVNQSGSSTNEPLFLPEGPYLYLPGSATNYLSTPAASSLDVDGAELWVWAYINPASWTPASDVALLSRYSGSAGSTAYMLYMNTAGQLRLYLSDGSSILNATTSVAPGVTGAYWVGAHWRSSDGRVQFWKASPAEGPDGAKVQVGTDKSIAHASVNNSAVALEFGSWNVGGANRMTGRFYRALIRDAGGDVCDLRASDPDAYNSTAKTVTSEQGQVFTISRSATGLKVAAALRPLFLFATDDFIEVDDHADLDFEDEDLTVAFAGRYFDVGNFGLVTKKVDTAAGTPGWHLYTTSGSITIQAADGATAGFDTEVLPTPGEVFVAAGRIEAASLTYTAFLDGAGTGQVRSADSAPNTEPLYIGRGGSGFPAWLNGEFYGAALIRAAESDADVALASAELLA